MLLAGAVVIFFGLVPSPKEIGLANPDGEEVGEDEESQEQDTNEGINS